MNHYSSLDANAKIKKGKKSNLPRALMHAAWAFIRTYILRFGFLDGKEGFILSFSCAEASYYRYLKILFSEENTDHATCHTQ